MAIIGPGMNDYTYSARSLRKKLAPRVPVLEDWGILDGSEKLTTTTGTKEVNNYVEKNLSDTYYWFGSDTLGRDIWTRVWSGARVSLIIAVVATVIDMIIGMSYGLISGYFGGVVDNMMQCFAEICNSIPRLVIARALVMNPKLIIADECISALDVSIQAQVVNLMKDIQKQAGTSYLFIAHDLSMVKYISDRIGVLHLGHLVERGTTEEIFSHPIHPYTRSLLSAIPPQSPDGKDPHCDVLQLPGVWHRLQHPHAPSGGRHPLCSWHR